MYLISISRADKRPPQLAQQIQVAAAAAVSARNRPRSKQQLAAISDWFVTDKKHSYKQRSKSGHVRSKRSSFSSHMTDEDRELLLPPEAVVDVLSAVLDTMSFKVDQSFDRDFDRQVSLSRLSSGSSYAGSLFSWTTTLDGNFSGDVKESSATTRPAEEEAEEEVRVEREREKVKRLSKL
ncbi:hypothetical protein ACLB2K_013268 [Fragaria x ananassa]